MKRINFYKFLYENNLTLYSYVFLIRQLFYFILGIYDRKIFTKFGNRALHEHFNWEIKKK